jgi:hypothetical protein
MSDDTHSTWMSSHDCEETWLREMEAALSYNRRATTEQT